MEKTGKGWKPFMNSRKMNTTIIVQPLWKISDVAQYLGIPLKSVYSMTGPKAVIRIPHIRIAGKVRFRKADIDLWLDQCMVAASKFLKKALPKSVGDLI
ncbi:MAG: helix-turn-helix domain-containing protein [Acidobacteria bacterium]|nr:helix-turn-helix domain-containing protein [Acidobacteriota bacterium]